MNTLVVDASVAVKWFLPEIHSEAAGRILKSKRKLLAPDLIFAEVGNTLWKKNVRQEITAPEAKGILQDFLRFPLQIYSSKILVDVAWNLAIQSRISVYDGLYLALALGGGFMLVTADRKFYESLQQGIMGEKLIWIEDTK
ncbi:MAG: type II toxin-antitoxin system VapC family toxin [Candidatus Omnitrophica bacterium]|nr:type II toxin-antitoxin system VapC family toxin [Candidatus Omnitrophota bacterium]